MSDERSEMQKLIDARDTLVLDMRADMLDLIEVAREYQALIRSDYEGRDGTFGSMQSAYDKAELCIKSAEALLG